MKHETELVRIIEMQRRSARGYLEYTWICREHEQDTRARELRAKYAIPYPRRDMPSPLFSREADKPRFVAVPIIRARKAST